MVSAGLTEKQLQLSVEVWKENCLKSHKVAVMLCNSGLSSCELCLKK